MRWSFPMKRVIFSVLFTLYFLLSIESAPAQTVSAGMLYEQCSAVALDKRVPDSTPATHAMSLGFCMGYFHGALQSWITLDGAIETAHPSSNIFKAFPRPSCMGKNTDITQMALVFVKHVRDNPEVRHKAAFAVFLDAVDEVFCATD
jgi:hypothetical protein